MENSAGEVGILLGVDGGKGVVARPRPSGKKEVKGVIEEPHHSEKEKKGMVAKQRTSEKEDKGVVVKPRLSEERSERTSGGIASSKSATSLGSVSAEIIVAGRGRKERRRQRKAAPKEKGSSMSAEMRNKP